MGTDITGAHSLEFNEATHRYKLDGKPVPGVTTLLKATLPEGEGLIGWRSRQAATFVSEWWGGLEIQPSKAEVDATIGNSLSAYRAGLREAGEIGTALHAYIEAFERSGEDVAEQALAVQQTVLKPDAFEKLGLARKSYQQHRRLSVPLSLLESEVAVSSVSGAFAGKFDRLHRREGRAVLSDFKTSKAIYPSHLFQLGGYSIAIKEWLGITVQEFEILRFGKDGSFEPLTITSPSEILELERQFMRCRETYNVLKKYDKKLGGTYVRKDARSKEVGGTA